MSGSLLFTLSKKVISWSLIAPSLNLSSLPIIFRIDYTKTKLINLAKKSPPADHKLNLSGEFTFVPSLMCQRAHFW